MKHIHCKSKSRMLIVPFLHFIVLVNFQVFPANKDRNTAVEHLLVTAFNARLIRFHPKTYHGYTSMRVEVYGCRNGMCMNPIHMLKHYHVDPKRKLDGLVRILRSSIFQNTLYLTYFVLLFGHQKSISRYSYFPIIIFAYELKFALRQL